MKGSASDSRPVNGVTGETDLHIEVGDVLLVKVPQAFQNLTDAAADLREKREVQRLAVSG